MAVDADELDLPEHCPNCGKPIEEWTENDGRGVISGGITYCSTVCGLKDAARAQED